MNYWIQGDAAKADKIRAAFEKLGYDVETWRFTTGVYYTLNGRIVNTNIGSNEHELILNNPDYKELKLLVEPKFKVGDWLVYENGDCFTGGLREEQVQTVEKDRYIFTHNTYGSFRFIDSNCRLWSIADAKDGDIIGFNDCTHDDGSYIDWVGIYMHQSNDFINHQHFFHCVATSMNTFRIGGSWRVFTAYPATKEQRDLLFRKMKEAGYQWDADKKELRKIRSHYDIANLHAGMPVLVRNSNESVWVYLQYSHRESKYSRCFNAGGQYWYQCIPFNEDTKHLLGATDMCPEEYINW